ncbi:MAG: hypothetical protein RR123_01425 [Clostridia bacterium]
MTKKKSFIIVIALFITLIIVFSVSLALTLQGKDDKMELLNSATILLKFNGEEHKIDVAKLKEIGTEEFKAVYKPSGIEPVEKIYTGVELIKILNYYNVALTEKSQIYFNAVDGMAKVYTAESVKLPQNVYIAYLVNGKPFNKTSTNYKQDEQEDGAPYVVIKTSDKFSQNRCKFLVEIEVK